MMLPLTEHNDQLYEGTIKSLQPREPMGHPMARFFRHLRGHIRGYGGLTGICLICFLLLRLVDLPEASDYVLEKVAMVSSDIAPIQSAPAASENTTLHIVIPTNKEDINLCKTLLGLSLLGYPSPTLVAWKQDFHDDGILGGGSHLAKVSRVLDYLNKLSPEQDDELVLMIDAYDIWFQLPYATFIDRYFSVTANAQARLVDTLGREAVEDNKLSQQVLFGSGKRCAPNQPQTVACYAIPESPLPDDLYGHNTDTIIGHNVWYSNKQRYLNSGYIIGPAGAMRKVFTQAWKQIQEHPAMDPNDNGSHGSDFTYHGSDQSIFADMFGRQEWVRERLRLDKAGPDAIPRTSHILGTFVDNVLNPSITHEHFEPDLTAGNPYEFGMHLDYWSDFGHQTINSELDAHWIVYDGDKPPEQQCGFRTAYGCPLRLPKTLPVDILNSSVPLANDGLPWAQRRLYTHVCLSRIPVMIHHNGIKERREDAWNAVWYQPDARSMLSELQREFEGRPPRKTLSEHQRAPRLESAGGAWTDNDSFMQWDELCPGDWDKEIFRDQ